MSELTREKFLSREEVKIIKDCLKSQMLLAKSKGNIRGVKRYYIIELMLNSGLRVSETCTLRFENIFLNTRNPYIQVINGKGGKNRIVYVSSEVKKLVEEYKEWKILIDEPVANDAYVFTNEQRHPYAPRSVQIIMRDLKTALCIHSKCVPHSLRHSYATYLYENTKDLRLVQKQLGHSKIETTTIYSDVTPESASRQVEGLWRE